MQAGDDAVTGKGLRGMTHSCQWLLLGLVLANFQVASASDPWAEITVRTEDLVGTRTCSGTSCHGSPHARVTSGTISQQEFVLWFGNHGTFHDGRQHYDPRARLAEPAGDPHSRAAWRMMQPRYQEVLRRASVQADGSVDSSMAARCAGCHDPLSVGRGSAGARVGEHPAPSIKYSVLSTQYPVLRIQHSLPAANDPISGTSAALATNLRPEAVERGIGCESCHGGARRWLAVHYERDVSREELTDLGIVDTQNFLVRGRVCAACHVGSTANDMNHDMLAAGHPPLQFELASYEALLKHKHWDDRPRRAENPDYEFQLWAAGRLAAAEAALALLESRATRQEPNATSQTPWPEFAEMNCLACHQEIQPPIARHSERLRWRNWNVSLANSLAHRPPVLEAPLRKLDRLFTASLMPDASEVAKAAREAKAALASDVRISEEGMVLSAPGQPLVVGDLLQHLADVKNGDNWEDACQQVAALAAVRRTFLDRGVDPSALPDRELAEAAHQLQWKNVRGAPNMSAVDPLGGLPIKLEQITETLLKIELQMRPQASRKGLR